MKEIFLTDWTKSPLFRRGSETLHKYTDGIFNDTVKEMNKCTDRDSHLRFWILVLRQDK